MLSWIGIEKGGVALKKKYAYDFARYSEPDKVHEPVPFPEKTTLFPGILVLSLSLRLF